MSTIGPCSTLSEVPHLNSFHGSRALEYLRKLKTEIKNKPLFIVIIVIHYDQCIKKKLSDCSDILNKMPEATLRSRARHGT